MILSLDPKDPIINFLKKKLIEIPFKNTSKYGSFIINRDQSLMISGSGHVEIELNFENLILNPLCARSEKK